MRTLIAAGLVCMFSMTALYGEEGGKTIALWPEAAPGAVGSTDKDKPELIYYLPAAEKARGEAIVICPGGGYARQAMDHEGHQIARWFSDQGVASFILKYRLPTNGYRHPIPLMDAQRAIRLVRSRAAEWKVRPDRIGILGFSAGGHLASSAGTHFQGAVVLNGQKSDTVDALSCRPDFMVLIYPVISMQDGITHGGSKENLLGPNPPAELVDLMSNEKQITAQTPPTFLIHANDDRGVVPQNSILFYQGLNKAGVEAELHIFPKGGHGFGMRPETGRAAEWPKLCLAWLSDLNHSKNTK